MNAEYYIIGTIIGFIVVSIIGFIDSYIKKHHGKK